MIQHVNVLIHAVGVSIRPVSDNGRSPVAGVDLEDLLCATDAWAE
jgi:hypothetical protein